ncbi:N-acetylmuramoyl-L-alanine amidase [Paenibacillus sp. GCM10012307]|uniref:N-acetylmuramoyl-L-alanine amidase n=1 Tax=Paenibacillus roseus TaxID=2798579 RepID=A0A934MP25_9BACL|nr:N-acetylmuramoyl-L-alanine amidase [Paenibacillus roseus]MBJ6360443.1 N-acetylmuramoyl-L-alanine amidase [Paenibacillus roseus]
MSTLKIALDAGHGPATPGKRTPDGSMREFQFNSVVAKYAAELLARCPGVQTLFTHAGDGSRDVPLKERTDRANSWGADLLVSIHANASGDGWSNAEGIETFTYSVPSAASTKLAQAIQSALIAATGLRDRGVKTANFHMLRESKMPSVLVECGFMTNQKEAELLKSDAYRRKCAAAIVSGISEVYGFSMPSQTESDTPDQNAPQIPQNPSENSNNSSKKTEYSDVKANSWYEDAIHKVSSPDIALMTGYPDGTFKPDQPVGRGELAVILTRLLNRRGD